MLNAEGLEHPVCTGGPERLTSGLGVVEYDKRGGWLDAIKFQEGTESGFRWEHVGVGRSGISDGTDVEEVSTKGMTGIQITYPVMCFCLKVRMGSPSSAVMNEVASKSFKFLSLESMSLASSSVLMKTACASEDSISLFLF